MESTLALTRRLYSDAPPAQSRRETNPTLLVSWWATGFSLTIILIRVCGRYIRTERLFPEDRIMALSIIPLLIRMGFVHMVLLWGTNNAVTTGFSAQDVSHRELGSRMVLGARIFYALFIWTAKFSVTAFLKRLTDQIWRRSFQHVLLAIRYFLLVTFIAVVLATLTECQPFDHYWQVIPDPGPKCRQGYAQLITMGTCDVITDLLLIGFPIPIIFLSAMPTKRKVSLILLFGLSSVLIAITCYRVPSVISRQGSQQYRSLLASLEILAAAAVSNAIVIGSFVRDRGLKKHKFKAGSLSESVEQASSRRATITHHHWGSDADLVGDLGIRLDPELRSPSYQKIRPAPVAIPSACLAKRGSIDPNWQFSYSQAHADDDRTSATDSMGGLKKPTPTRPPKTRPCLLPTCHCQSLPKRCRVVFSILPPTGMSGAHLRHNIYTPDAQDSRLPRKAGLYLNAVSGLLSPAPTYSGSSESSLQRPSPPSVRNFSRPTTANGTPNGARVNSPANSPRSGSPGTPPRNRRAQLTPSRAGPLPELQDLGGLLKQNDDVERKPRG
ncbi:hypothetical protein CIHG_00420 [Coccidioides immitis H538.4]|uniref:Rhodopsin domain-containing protein n=1 Tax=Coccidioides immitis H538.4 TaxID=396776 RepID=A0A0J8RFC0_COCIT|nr:hypothetical protein CIHG_00420 [Coccidioides immitis H538.4]